MNSQSLELETNQYSHNFKYSLERVWLILKNISILSLISGNSHYHPIFQTGNEFKLGSKFIGVLFGQFPYNGTVNKIKEFPGYKKIKWIFNFEKESFLSFKIELFKVTEDNTSISLFTFKYDLKLKEKILTKTSKDKINLVLERIDKILKESSNDLIQYESGVISSSMEDIWDFITNFNKLKMITPLIKFNCYEDIKESNFGDILFLNLENKKLNIKILVKNKNEKWNKWIYVLQIMKGDNKNPMQKLIVELTKINQSDCQLILLTKFDECTNNVYIQKISEEKKYIIKSIKDYLENYKN